MQTVPHVDVVGDARIREILEREGNYLFGAVSCETLDGWVADFGLTPYPVRSIYRPPSVATAGIASMARHRFWSTIDGETDHTGPKYVALVMYDAADEACPLEFRLGADDIGRIEPTRHDNRRHLFVIDRPVTFQGEMEVFQVVAPGTGTYRIETFALLRERPEPSTFAPSIDHLSARVAARTERGVVAEVHFTTSEVADCRVDVWRDGPESGSPLAAHDVRSGRLHAIELPVLEPDRRYTARVTATEASGATTVATLEFDTNRDILPDSPAVTVPLRIVNGDRTTGRVAGLPLTFGVPLPRGRIRELPACRLRSGGRDEAAQARIHARWPDGSARWALIDAPCPVELAPGGTADAVVIVDQEDVAADAERSALTWSVQADHVTVTGRHLRVTVAEGGPLPPAVVERRATDGSWRSLWGAADGGGFNVVLGDETVLGAGPIEDVILEEAGAERAVVRYRVPHRDEDGTIFLRSTVRVQVYGRHPFVRLGHRLEVMSPRVRHGGTDTRTLGEEATLLDVRSATLSVPFSHVEAMRFEGEVYPLASDGAWRVVQEHDLAYRIEQDGVARTIERRSDGRITVSGTAGQLGLRVRHFWETYPNAIQVQPDSVTVELLPTLSDEPIPGDEDAWHRLAFWRNGNAYKLKVGMALTRNLLLVFPPDEADEAELDAIDAWFARPPAVRPDLAWLNATGAWSPIAPKAGSPLTRYEAWVDEAHGLWLDDREQTRAYGFLNFGDWYGESSWSWGNNEYDAAFAHHLEFLRGGEPDWFRLAGEAARHLADVDTCNASPDPAAEGGQYMHMPGHAGGYLPPFFRSKMAGSTMIPSHMWVEGPTLHYLLTGDESVRDSLARSAAWLIRGDGEAGLDRYDFRNLRECGWHMTHLSALARLSDDPRYLNAARLIVERVLERQDDGGGWDRLLTFAHCACPPPRHRGEAGFMAGILLSGLRRFHELTGDPRVADAIIRGARWVIASTYDAERGLFRYTTCPNKRQPSPEYTVPLLDGLVYANALRPDPTIRAVITRGFEDLGGMWGRLEHSGFGKTLCWQTRFAPAVLAYWQGALGEPPTTSSPGLG